MAGFCELGNENSSSIAGEELLQRLMNCCLYKHYSASRSYYAEVLRQKRNTSITGPVPSSGLRVVKHPLRSSQLGEHLPTTGQPFKGVRTGTHTHTHTFPSLTLFLELKMTDIVQEPVTLTHTHTHTHTLCTTHFYSKHYGRWCN